MFGSLKGSSNVQPNDLGSSFQRISTGGTSQRFPYASSTIGNVDEQALHFRYVGGQKPDPNHPYCDVTLHRYEEVTAGPEVAR